MINPSRWKLVGLETLDGSVLPDVKAYAIADGLIQMVKNLHKGELPLHIFHRL